MSAQHICLLSLIVVNIFPLALNRIITQISAILENHQSMEVYINQIESSQKLKRTGFDINEMWVGSLLLDGLPNTFCPTIKVVEHCMAITTDSFKTKFLDMRRWGERNGRNGALRSNETGCRIHNQKSLLVATASLKNNVCRLNVRDN